MTRVDDESKQSQMRKVGLLSVIVADLVGYTGAGVGIGYWGWSRWHMPWYFLLGMSLLGMITAMWRMYEISKKEL